MFRLASLGLCASFGFQLAAGRFVRRVYTDDAGVTEGSQEDQAESSGTHCVVWGDWSFEGKNFRSKEDADTYFKKMKRTELAAIQFHGSRKVNKFMSKRLTHVDWAKMATWCEEHHKYESLVEEASPQMAEVHARQSGAATPAFSEDVSDGESSLFEASSAERRMPRRSRLSYHPVIASLAATSAGESTAKATTLSGKVALLENEVTSLASKASGLLKSIGVDGSNGASALELDPSVHSHGKLKSRLAALEEHTAGVQEKTNLLETEFYGTTTAEKAVNSRKQVARSFKMQIEALAAQVDELKSRLSALESTPLLGEVAKLEDTTAHLGSKAAQIFTSIGAESVTTPKKPSIGNQALKARLSSLEGYAEDVQRNAAALEYEILGNSWTPPASSSSRKASCIKDEAASLGDQLHDLESRLSALASAPIVTDVDKMEDAVTSLASRAASLSKNVGISGKAPQSLHLAPQGSPVKARIVSLEGYVGNMQTMTADLEEELAGNVGAAPAQSQKDTLKSKARFLELQIENMNSRISALEQQV